MSAARRVRDRVRSGSVCVCVFVDVWRGGRRCLGTSGGWVWILSLFQMGVGLYFFCNVRCFVVSGERCVCVCARGRQVEQVRGRRGREREGGRGRRVARRESRHSGHTCSCHAHTHTRRTRLLHLFVCCSTYVCVGFRSLLASSCARGGGDGADVDVCVAVCACVCLCF